MDNPFGPQAAKDPATKHADDVHRLDFIYDTAEKSAEGITNALVPAYVAAATIATLLRSPSSVARSSEPTSASTELSSRLESCRRS